MEGEEGSLVEQGGRGGGYKKNLSPDGDLKDRRFNSFASAERCGIKQESPICYVISYILLQSAKIMLKKKSQQNGVLI